MADGGPHDHLHLAQAARGEGGLRPRHGAARGQDGRDRRDEGRDAALARRADGRPRGAGSRSGSRASGEVGEPVLEVDGLWAAGDRGDEALRGVVADGARGRDPRDRRRRRQRPARARRDDHRHAPADARRRSTVDGRRLRGGDAREAIRAGVAHVPEDRLHTGVAPSLSIASNVVLKSYRGTQRHAAGPLLRLRTIRDYAAQLIERYDVRGGGPELPARQLSGGNLQKVVLAREFEGEPRVLVVASPTRGLDVAAIETVHRYLRDAAARRRRRAAHLGGPRRDPRARRPDRGDVRGRDRRRGRRRRPRRSRRSGC